MSIAQPNSLFKNVKAVVFWIQSNIVYLQCKYDFCWVCLEAWKKHSTATGGYFRCNRYEVVKKVEDSHDQMKTEVIVSICFLFLLIVSAKCTE